MLSCENFSAFGRNMRKRIIVVFAILSVAHFGTSTGHKRKKPKLLFNTSQEALDQQENMNDFEASSNVSKLFETKVANFSETFTQWTEWSRCIDCLQRRMKICVHSSCHKSRMYEERECNKKRCKRKLKKNVEFHVVHLNASRSYLTKQGPSETWSKWTKWTDCSPQCRTTRVRKCKKLGRCRNQMQKETAYCYHENTKCEFYVLNLIESKHVSNPLDSKRYQYTFNHNQYITREPKRKQGKCGISFSKPYMLKIIGGTEAEKYKWPWHVAILNHYFEVFCGGTLIGSRWVLTASHCIRKYLRVRLNAHDLRSTDGSDIEMVVSKMFPHPRFDFKTVDNDIALLMLPKNVRVPVACLPNRRPRAGQLCSVMGWGKIDTSVRYGVPVLHETKLPLVKHRICKRSYKEFLISENMLCAGWKSGKSDTCAGDSGGGLMCLNRKPKKQMYNVQGITSFGDGCGERNKYGIYTAVFNYVKWIHYIMDHYS